MQLVIRYGEIFENVGNKTNFILHLNKTFGHTFHHLFEPFVAVLTS